MREITKTLGNADIVITKNNLSALGIKEGHKISIKKWHPQITLKQLRFVHAYFGFCIEHGGERVGHYDAHAFWTDAKAWLKAAHPIAEFQRITLSDMTMEALEKILRIIDLEYIQEIIEIDTSLFWAEYEDWIASGTELEFDEWVNYSEDKFL